MIKNLIIVILMLVVFNGLFIYSGGFEALIATEEKTTPTQMQADIVDAFRFTLEEEVVKKVGQPIEGFEPHMFLSAFPGLVASDFQKVESSIGFYTYADGKLDHTIGDHQGLVHSAAGAVTRAGIETLLKNVAVRTDIDLAESGTLTDIISVITQ